MSPVQPARIDYVPAFPAIQFTQRALLHPPREGRHEPQRVAGEGIADATVLPVRIGGAIRDKPSFPPRISANSAVKPQALFAPNKPFESLKLAIAGQSQAAQIVTGPLVTSLLAPHAWKQAHPESVRQYRQEERRQAADRSRVRRASRRLKPKSTGPR